MIDEVVLMDAGKALRNDHLDAKVHGRNGRVFAARALSIVAAANDEALFMVWARLAKSGSYRQ